MDTNQLSRMDDIYNFVTDQQYNAMRIRLKTDSMQVGSDRSSGVIKLESSDRAELGGDFK